MFLKICFFLPILAFVVYYLLRAFNAKDALLWQRNDAEETKRYEARKKTNPSAKAEYSSAHIGRSLIGMSALAFEFIGLLSSSWFVFLGCIVGGLTLSFLLWPMRNTVFRVWVMSGFHAIMFLFALINSFHLHLRADSFWDWWLSVM